MAYPNVPPDKTEDMNSCVHKVMAEQGYEKERAIAICHASVVEGKALDSVISEEKGAEHPWHGGRPGEIGGSTSSGGGGGGSSSTGRGYRTQRDEWSMVNRRLAAGGLKRGERALLERRAERLAKGILGVKSKQADDELEAPDITNIDSAIAHLERAVELHQAHMDGSQPTSGESQAELMDHIESALSSLVIESNPGTEEPQSEETKSNKSLKQRIVAAIASVFAPDPKPTPAAAFDAGTVGRVFKQADGRYRWVLFTSNSFEDGDREIVSQKALSDDVAHSDASGDYGPLLWWHVPNLELGMCDYRAMHDRMLVESGTFHLEAVGRAMKDAAQRVKASLGFFHPLTDPDGDKVFHTVRTFERSLLPAIRAANQLTALPVITRKESSMDEKKFAQLKELLGDDLAAQVVKQAAAQQKAAADAGVRYKEGDKALTDDEKKKQEEGISDDTPVTVGMLKEVIAGLRAEYDAKLGESAAPMAEEMKERKKKAEDIAQRMGEAESAIKRLTGNLPKAVKTGFRASEAGPVPDEAKTKEINPPPNPLDPIMSLLSGRPAAPGQ